MRRGLAGLFSIVLLATSGTAAAAGPPAPTARVWVTTVDRSELLHERAPVAFRRGASTHQTIVVNPEREYQRMDGFGASITDSAASVLHRLEPAARDRAMRDLFDPKRGIGVSFLRQPIGSSDFTATAEHYSYNDMPPGQTDFALRHFSIDHDRKQILPLLRQAKRLNPALKIMGSPWSPPGWMKTSDSLEGGRLKDDPRIYDAYARYLAKFVQEYQRAGVRIDYLTVQNEPQNRHLGGYPGAAMPVRQQAEVIKRLGPLLRGSNVKILGYDHNWSTHPGDVETTPPGEDPETDYPYKLLNTSAAKWIAGTAYHCYSGDPSAQTAMHDAHPDKGIWFTECSGSHGPDDTAEQIFRGTLTWHARNLVIGVTRNWGKTVVNWNIALDSTGGPHLGGCETCTGLLTLLPDNTIRADAEFYTIGHLAKFVRPGAVRIASTSFGTTGWNGQIMDVAFRNPDGSTALIVHNQNDDPRPFAVNVGDRTFEYTLPGGALATFTWPSSRTLDARPGELDLTGATAVTEPAGEGVPPGEGAPAGEGAALAVDGDAATRWSSGTAQAAGQYLQVDLGKPRTFRRVAVDSGGNLGDYARAWKLSISRDGRAWRDVASGTGTGQLTTIDLPPTTGRHLRITATEASSSWWSVSDLRLYKFR